MFAVVAAVAVPGVCVTVIVNVWAVPTSLVALAAMATEPSTYFLVAGPEPSGPEPIVVVVGSGSRGSWTPPTVNTAGALAVIVLTVVELTVTVQVAVLPTKAMAAPQVSLT